MADLPLARVSSNNKLETQVKQINNILRPSTIETPRLAFGAGFLVYNHKIWTKICTVFHGTNMWIAVQLVKSFKKNIFWIEKVLHGK